MNSLKIASRFSYSLVSALTAAVLMACSAAPVAPTDGDTPGSAAHESTEITAEPTATDAVTSDQGAVETAPAITSDARVCVRVGGVVHCHRL
jgi:hypothetical protein